MEMEDEKIITMLFDRREDALRELELSHKRAGMAVALSVTGNSMDAEECWNDTCFAIWNSIPPARPTSLRAYLLKIIRNRALNLAKARQTQKRHAILVELDECVSGNSGIEEMEAGEIGKWIDEFLESLPKQEAAIFMRRYFCSEPVKDIAKRMGLRENQVSKILGKLRKKLRRHLMERGIDLCEK